MTIRLRCVQCHRKLKLPDEALGKKVQCPKCGVRFLAGTEPGPPPAEDTPPAPPEGVAPAASSVPAEPSGPVMKPDEPSVVDSLFADVAVHSLGSAALPLAPPGVLVFTPLDLDRSPAEAAGGEPIMSIDLNEPPAPILLERRDVPPADEAGRIEISLHTQEPGPDQPVSVRPRRRRTVGCLVVALLLLLLAGGVGYAVHHWSNRDIPDDQWQSFAPPGSYLNVQLPGRPERGPGAHEFTLMRRKEEMTFQVRYRNLPSAEATPQLDEVVEKMIQQQKRDTGAVEVERRSIHVALTAGLEVELRGANGEQWITRLFLVPVGDGYRLYEASVHGPNVRPDRGDAARFLNSFFVIVPPAGSRTPAAAQMDDGARHPGDGG